jgi:hypothetical protein
MAASLTPPKQAQLRQTIDIFQVIVQSDPTDYQTLEILKEAYMKLGMSAEVVDTSKKIAEAYVQLGQLSSAIMEYETILQQFPEDVGVRKALEEIESKTTSFAGAPEQPSGAGTSPLISMDVDDGRAAMKRIFVDGQLVGEDVFNRLWSTPVDGVGQLEEPFLQTLADKAGVHLEDAMQRVADRAKIRFIPIERYDTDVEVARKYPRHQSGCRQEGDRPELCCRPTLDPASRSRHYHDRGNSRCGDGGDRGPIRADRASGALDHAL